MICYHKAEFRSLRPEALYHSPNASSLLLGLCCLVDGGSLFSRRVAHCLDPPDFLVHLSFINNPPCLQNSDLTGLRGQAAPDPSQVPCDSVSHSCFSTEEGTRQDGRHVEGWLVDKPTSLLGWGVAQWQSLHL